MIDPNQIAGDVKTNWPAICAGALWLRTELRNVSEYVIGHGGIGWLFWKLIWNPPSEKEFKNL